MGDNVAIFEQGARHVGKDIAGKGIANPLATLLSTSMMFRHLNLPDFSDRCAWFLICTFCAQSLPCSVIRHAREQQSYMGHVRPHAIQDMDMLYE